MAARWATCQAFHKMMAKRRRKVKKKKEGHSQERGSSTFGGPIGVIVIIIY